MTAADLMALLLVFLVVLVSVGATNSPPRPSPNKLLLPEAPGLLSELQNSVRSDGVSSVWVLERTGEAVVLRLPTAALFDGETVAPGAGGRERLSRLAALVRTEPIQLAVRVALESGSGDADKKWQRAALRAVEVAKLLQLEGLDPLRLSTTVHTGLGPTNRESSSNRGAQVEILLRPTRQGEP